MPRNPFITQDEACGPREQRYVKLREMPLPEQATVEAYSRDKENGPLMSGQSPHRCHNFCVHPSPS